MAKFRSPNYPAVSLKEAVDRTRRLFGEARQSSVSEEAAVKAIGYTGLTGPSRGMLSALKKYGLVEDAPGGGVRISKLAMGILHATSDGERVENTRKAALLPPLFRRFHTEFSGVTDPILRSHLVREGFSDDGATKAIRAFRQTAEFANLSQSEAILDDTEDDDSEETEPEVSTKPLIANPKRDPAPPPPAGDAPAFRWPLPKGRIAELRVSGGRFTKADLTLLKQYLDLAEMTVEDEPQSQEETPRERDLRVMDEQPVDPVVVGEGRIPANSGPDPVRTPSN